MNNSDKHKRRLNYISAEDFYFLTYEMILTLSSILTSADSLFKDHRKLSYLVHLISDPRIIGVLERNKGRYIPSTADKELLFSSFTAGELHKGEIYKILLALQKKGFVSLQKSAEAEVLDIKLNKTEIPKEFLQYEGFNADRKIIDRIKKITPRISSLSIETFLSRIYRDYGLNIWAS